jgi:ribonuclease R
MKQAYYSPKNIGHAGLASPRYSHFTSPIRRYPDLVAHRALLATIGVDDVAPRADELFDAGEHSSNAEREAMKIERDADDVCMCFLLERRLAEAGWDLELEGEVVGVISKGLFVEFGEEGFEGFLPIRRMRGDWWDINEEETALVGADSGRRIRIGDPLRVAVGRVDAPRGRADLELAAD